MGDLQDLQEDLDDFAYSALHGLSGLAISLSLSGKSARRVCEEDYLYIRLSREEEEDDDGFLVTLLFCRLCVFYCFPLFFTGEPFNPIRLKSCAF